MTLKQQRKLRNVIGILLSIAYFGSAIASMLIIDYMLQPIGATDALVLLLALVWVVPFVYLLGKWHDIHEAWKERNGFNTNWRHNMLGR